LHLSLLSIFPIKHTAIQRDEFVKIDYDNIVPGAMRNFEKYTTYVSMFKTPYDFTSIMHYSRGAFALDKTKPTIEPLEDAPVMGQRKGE
jgi:Astacin (Peptidase family M12A)